MSDQSFAFSPITEAVLIQAGWSSARWVDITADLALLQEFGYPVFPVVERFLHQYSGVLLICQRGSEHVIGMPAGFKHCDLHFALPHAMLYPEEIEVATAKIGRPVCIIGEAGGRNITLLMDAQGAVHGCCEDNTFYFGATAEAAIDALITDYVQRFGMPPGVTV
jgi:hypothetical protein